MENNDIELTVAALEACGYRVRVREKNYTRWVTACKGLDVKYVTWHPMTNINQAMQLLIDCPGEHGLFVSRRTVMIADAQLPACSQDFGEPTPQDLINAQCRAIVTACASLKAVR